MIPEQYAALAMLTVLVKSKEDNQVGCALLFSRMYSSSNSNSNKLYCHIRKTQYNFKKRQSTYNRLKYKYFPTSSNTYNMAKGAGNPLGFMGPSSVTKYKTCIITGCSVHLDKKTKCAYHHWQCNITPRRQIVDILYIKNAVEIEIFWWL